MVAISGRLSSPRLHSPRPKLFEISPATWTGSWPERSTSSSRTDGQREGLWRWTIISQAPPGRWGTGRLSRHDAGIGTVVTPVACHLGRAPPSPCCTTATYPNLQIRPDVSVGQEPGTGNRDWEQGRGTHGWTRHASAIAAVCRPGHIGKWEMGNGLGGRGWGNDEGASQSRAGSKKWEGPVVGDMEGEPRWRRRVVIGSQTSDQLSHSVETLAGAMLGLVTHTRAARSHGQAIGHLDGPVIEGGKGEWQKKADALCVRDICLCR